METSPTFRKPKNFADQSLKKNLLHDFIHSTEQDLKKLQRTEKKQLKRDQYSINSFSNSELRNYGSVSRLKQMTVDKLLSKNETGYYNYTERETNNLLPRIKLNRFFQVFSKNSEILEKICMPKHEELRFCIDNMRKEITENKNLSEIVKITLFDVVYEILKAFHESSKEILSLKTELNAKISQLMKNSTLQKLELESPSKPSPNKDFFRHEPKKPENPKNIDQIQSKFDLEKLKLEEKISILESHLKELQSFTKVNEMQQEIEKYKKINEVLEKKIEKIKLRNKTTAYKYQLQLGEIKAKTSEDSQFVKNFSSLSSNYLQKIEILEREKFELQEKLNVQREKFFMLVEDFERFAGYREKFQKTLEQLHTMKLRYNQLELEVIAGSASRSTDSVSWISIHDPIFEKVKIGYTLSESLLGNVNMENISEFKLESPSYAALLDLNDDKYGFEQQYSNWLEVNIRGIMDSKYYEHLNCSFDSGRTPSRFPDFVYSWIGKFCIDEKTRDVTELEWWKKETIDSLRIKFLLGLRHSNAKKVWELYTFQEFLNEELLLDELAFYLHCRNLLFKGPQLSLTHGKYSSLHYVDRDHVNDLIDSLMPKLSSKEKTELKAHLYSKTKSQTENNGIDSGFVIFT